MATSGSLLDSLEKDVGKLVRVRLDFQHASTELEGKAAEEWLLRVAGDWLRNSGMSRGEVLPWKVTRQENKP